LRELDAVPDVQQAAKLYQWGGKWKLAANTYEKMGDYTIASLLYEEQDELWTATQIMLRGYRCVVFTQVADTHHHHDHEGERNKCSVACFLCDFLVMFGCCVRSRSRHNERQNSQAFMAFVRKHKDKQDVVFELVDHYKKLKNYEAGAKVR
jgi:hypothetical protein